MRKLFRTALIGAALCLFLGRGVRADADQTSPKAAMKSFWSAIDQGDADAAKKVCKFDDAQAKWVEGFAAMCDGFQKLHDSAAAKFGADDKTFTAHSPGYYAGQLVDKCTVTEDGDSAKIVPPGQKTQGMTVVREDGKWVMDLKSSMVGDTTSQAAHYQAIATAAHDVAKNIDDGKYDSAKSAEADFKAKLKAALGNANGK